MVWQPDYVTLAQQKHYLRIEHPGDTADDTELAFDITAGSRDIDTVCSHRHNGLGARRQFGQVAAPEVRYYTPRWDAVLMAWVIEIDDLGDTTGLIVQVSQGNDRSYTATITDYILRPMNALADKRVYTQILIKNSSAIQPTYFEDSAKITALWGWTAFPTSVIRATLLQTHRINKRRNSPMGTSGSPQKGTTQELLADVDPDVLMILDDYIKLGRTP